MATATNFSLNGNALGKLLQQAAGLDGKRLKWIEVRVAAGEAVKFTAEILADDEQIGKALSEQKGGA